MKEKISAHINVFLVFGLVFLLYTGCKTGKVTHKPAFKIIEKTFYNWTGGQPGVKGTNVVLKLRKVNLNTFKADSLYFTDKGVALETHLKKDTLVLMAYFSTSAPLKLVVEPSLKSAVNKKNTGAIPYKLRQNEVVLSYFINGYKKHLLIKDVKETKKKYYP